MDWEAQCLPVEDELNSKFAATLDVEKPEGECLNWDAWYYVSDTECDGIW